MSLAEIAFMASLPVSRETGQPSDGHTTWEQLGPRAKARWLRIANAVRSATENES